MGIGNYASASMSAVQELAAALTTEDVRALASELAKEGIKAWVDWQVDHESEIQDYVAATPSQRQKKKRWNDPALRPRLVLAALTHCLAAAELLGFLHAHEFELLPGGPYRDTTALAGSLYWKIMHSDVPHWPEAYLRVVPSPFDSS